VLLGLFALNQRQKPRSTAEKEWKRLEGGYRRRYVYRVLLGAAALAAAGWLLAIYGSPPTQSDIDAKALLAPKIARPFQAPYPVDPQTLAGIDMDRVHGQLFPAWIIALQHKPHSVGRANAERAFADLRSEAGRDPNLGGLLDRIHEGMMDGTYDFHGELRALIKGWNDYLAQGGIPFRLEHHIAQSAEGPQHRARFYRVVADIPVSTERSMQHVLVLARQDRTNLTEGFLGQTSTDPGTALIMTDRIAQYAIERIWPLFDRQSEITTSALLERVRAEAREELSEPTLDALTRTLLARRQLEAELRTLSQRRGCGAGVVIENVPWNGLSNRALALVNGVAQKNERRGCPRVTLDDADHISTLSERLSNDASLVRALGELAAWVGKSVVAHEARHLADSRDDDHLDPSNFCRDCPATFDYATRAEVAAYLASFATPHAGYVALLQACGNESSRGGTHSTALEFVLPKLLADGCSGPVPEDLYSQAAAVHAQLFGRTRPVALPTSFPTTIPIPLD
jgi:hypothetical protein